MSATSEARIYNLIQMFDADTRIPEAFNEQRVTDLALIVLEKACRMNPDTPVIDMLGVALRQYLTEKASTDA